MLNVSERVYEREVAKPRALPLVNELVISRVILLLAMGAGVFLRIWQINAMGYNTDEAVYAGQAAAIARIAGLKEVFPIFRAHPLLFQFLLSIIDRVYFSDLAGRLFAVVFRVGYRPHNLRAWENPLWTAAGGSGSHVHGTDAIPRHRFTPGAPGWYQ